MMGPAGWASYAEGGRSHASLTCLGGLSCIGPPVGREKMIPTNGRTNAVRTGKTGIRATKWPPHAQWARPGRTGLLWCGGGDDTTGDAVAGVAGWVGLHIVCLFVDDDGGASVGDDAVG
jgi:hypothetical protein